MYSFANDKLVGSPYTYSELEDGLYDLSNDDDVEEWINEIYPKADVEGFKFNVGTIYRRCGDYDFWEAVYDDFIRSEAEYIEEELEDNGSCDWYGFTITKI